MLALGGASWPRLGSDAAWVSALHGVAVAPFVASNCGVRIAWSDTFRARFAGTPLKRIALAFGEARVRGEAIVTDAGLEGGAVYALSAPIRAALAGTGEALLALDLRPDIAEPALAERLDGPRGSRSLANHLRVAGGLPPVAAALLREAPEDRPLSSRVKALPLRVTALAGLDRAISSAGGITWGALDARFMLRAHPGVFAAGEMLGWDAPTGGYLLTACLATGRAAAQGALSWCAGLPAPSDAATPPA